MDLNNTTDIRKGN
uniref:Uncharacterized protein n=1 Tax=Anguilla anguilla TaxID=7936 RepID=A0A0E9TAE0_ANGAN